MIDPAVFKKHKLDAESLKKKFDLTDGKEAEGIKRLRTLIRDRINRGMDYTLTNWRTWKAVDIAYDAPLHQYTPTIMRTLMSGCTSVDKAKNICSGWGISEDAFLCKVKEGGKDALRLNVPQIFTTLLPFTLAYTSVRVAKIFNDRNLMPLLKYEPAIATAKNKARCQVITQLVQRMTATMGYATTLQRMILNPLLYSVGMMFPEEPWFKDTQEDAEGKEFCVRQGVRYVLPHISRMFYDLNYPLASFNTDTGCEYAGYFTIKRYRDVVGNPLYWNKEKITYGTDWIGGPGYSDYFTQAYPCVLELPKRTNPLGDSNREDAAVYYQSGDSDKAIFVTPLFMKLVPKDWDLGDYKYPVWFRFFIAADDTVIYAEPYPYRPVTVTQYDPDQNRAQNASLALEIIPFQDLLGNLLTQIVLTIKRNLANVTFYDTNLNIDGAMTQFAQQNQWQYAGLQFIGYDSTRQKMVNAADPRNSFHQITFPFADTSQMFGAINTVISLLERLLVISPQEIGSAASHQQSKHEIVVIDQNTTNRVAYTASFIDEAIDAWKSQLYDALICYADEEFVAEVTADLPDAQKVIEELGFKLENYDKSTRKYYVKGNKKALALEGFASTKDGPDRGNDVAAGQAMALGIQSINQNPQAAAIADPVSILEGLTEAAKMSGAPDDFKIRTKEEAVVAQQAVDLVNQMGEQLKQAAVQEAVAQVSEQIAKPAAAAIQEHSDAIQEIQQNLAQTIATMESLTEAAQQAPPLMTPDQSVIPINPALTPPLNATPAEAAIA